MTKTTSRRAVLAGTAAAALTSGAAANVSSVAYASPYADLALRWREVTSQIDRRWEIVRC